MTASNPSHQREMEELVSQQIQAFKNCATMDDRDLFEYHLRALPHHGALSGNGSNCKSDAASARMVSELSLSPLIPGWA